MGRLLGFPYRRISGISSHGDKGAIGARAARQMKRALAIDRRARDKISEKKGLLKNVDKNRKLKLREEHEGPSRLVDVEGARLEIGGRA